jgi:hypothetical protein
MKTRLLLLSTALLFALAACEKPAPAPSAPPPAPKPAPPPAPTATQTCPPDCTVTVTVAETAASGAQPAKCDITAPKRDDAVKVTNGKQTLSWTLAAGYEFDDPNGILFPAASPPGLFTPHPGKQKFDVDDLNDQKAPHKYQINVSKTGGGGPKCTLDPYVINDQ